MSKAFDPTPYLEAARARRAAVAAGCDADSYTAGRLETAQIRHSLPIDRVETRPVAGVAGVAAPKAGTLPWAAGLSALVFMDRPVDRSPSEWYRLLDDCEQLNDDWGSKAHALGWSTCDLFGSPPDPYSAAVDQLGLALLLDGRAVLAMTARSATIGNRLGPPNTFYLHPWRRPGVPVWVAYGARNGP